MSSACVCHTDEWCFYCNMYSPLEREHEALKQENERLKEIDERECLIAISIRKENDKLKSENSKMRECLEWYGAKKTYELGVSITMGSAFPRHEPIKSDKGERARECLLKINNV